MSFNAAKINKKMSKIVFGCANDLMNSGGNADKILNRALELGINTFDTARQYGLSENSLGHWLKQQNREEIVLITKGSHPEGDRDRVTPEDIEADITQSLETLNTNYTDIYLLHRDDLAVEVGPIVEKLNQLVVDGRVKVFGGSNWTVERIKEANTYAEKHNLQKFTVSSPNFSLVEQIGEPWGGGPGSVTLTGIQNKDTRAWYKVEEIMILGYSSLGHGLLCGRITSENLDEIQNILSPPALKGFYYPENIERVKRADSLAKEKGCTIPQLAIAWILQQIGRAHV